MRIVLDASGHDEAARIADEIAVAVGRGVRSPRDFAVLFRTNALSRSLEVALRGRGIPYQLVRGLEFFKRREVRDVVAWLRLIRNPRDDDAALRVVNVPARGIGRQSLDRLAAWADPLRQPIVAAAARAAEVPGMPKRAALALAGFARLHGELVASAASDPRVAPLVEAVLDRTGYRAMLAEDQDDGEEGQDRLANVEELVTAARQHDDAVAPDGSGSGAIDPLGGFLETTALVADADAWDGTCDRVALMTFHAAKGLEFPVVHLMAMEDGVLPHERSLDHPDQLEEERRLVFVGITRGREEVVASCARIRDYRGTRRIAAPSLFLAEMTGSETVVTGAESPVAATFDPFGDAARRQGGDFDDLAQASDDPPAGPSRIIRQDGLTLELEDEVDGRRERPGRRGSGPAIERAAELAMRMAAGGQPARSYATGQRVRHAEYGEGVIAGISGSGARAVGTVVFSGPAGTRTFILGHGAIEPVS